VCGDDEKAKQVGIRMVAARSRSAGVEWWELENARIVESLTALLIGLNMRYKVIARGFVSTGSL